MNLLSLFVLILVIFIIFKLKVIPGNERCAEFVLGQFRQIRGPGIIFKWSGSEVVWERIAIDHRGELMNRELAQFDAVNVPVKVEGSAHVGDIVRITEFKDDQVWVMKDMNQSRYYVCEKCGHKNAVSVGCISKLIEFDEGG